MQPVPPGRLGPPDRQARREAPDPEAQAGRPGPLARVPHCVEGTNGEKRISGALLSRHIDLGLRNSTDLPEDIFER